MKNYLSPKKVTPRDCSPERRSRLNQRVWRINRMSIVSQTKAVGQFRCRLISGVPVYEQIIPTAGGPNNYQKVSRKVVEAAWFDLYKPAPVSVTHSDNAFPVVTKTDLKVTACA